MLVLVTYDVNTETEAGRRRLRKISKACENCGQRVQNSVFECSVNAAQLRLLKAQLCDIMDENCDSLRFYKLGDNYQSKVEHYGVKEGYDAKGLLIV